MSAAPAAWDPAARIGVLGLGAMGTPMAWNLLRRCQEAGGALWVHNRTAARCEPLVSAGASLAESPARLAAECDLVLVMVSELPVFEQLLHGPSGFLSGIRAAMTLVVSTTSSAAAVRDLAETLERETRHQVLLVDAPVSGGVEGAAGATLSVMVGCQAPLPPLAHEVLRTIGTPVVLGPLGAGQVAKAANQIIVSATALAIAEAVVIAERAGLDVPALIELLSGGYAASNLLNAKKRKFIEQDYSPDGKAVYMVKDLSSALGEAALSNSYTPLLSVLHREYTALSEAGYGEQDLAVVRSYIADTSSEAGHGRG